ncbi:MAG: hypothetical protein JNL98_34520 [Bryobacterales bacterium]|nr:hypothetical protein [Bryobacterales bacterium]
MRFFQWLAGTPPATHPDEETLLLHLDGELPAQREAQVREHLHACWKCRTESARLEFAVQTYMQSRRVNPQAPGPDAASSRMLDRLKEEHAKRLDSVAGQRATRLIPVFGALAAAVVALLILRPGPPPKAAPVPAASDLLRRAASAETAVRLPGAVRVTADSTVSNSLDQLRGALRKSGLDAADPLSARAIDHWRKSAPAVRESVRAITLEDGTRGWEVSAAPEDHQAEHPVREARVQLRASDYRPVRAVYAVRHAGHTTRYSVTPEVPSRLTVAPLQPGGDDAARILDRSEFEVHYLLHRSEACRRDFVLVSRKDDHILVTGIVDTPERKRELTAILRAARDTRTAISTAAEAALGANPLDDESDGAVLELESAPPLLLPLIEQHLRAGHSRAEAHKLVLNLSNRAVRLADVLTQESALLAQLIQAFPADLTSKLGAGQRLLLEQMLRDHALTLGSAAGELQALSRGIPVERDVQYPGAVLPPGGPLKLRAEFLKIQASAANRLGGALFAGLNLNAGDAAEVRAEFDARLASIQTALSGIDRHIADALRQRSYASAPERLVGPSTESSRKVQ